LQEASFSNYLESHEKNKARQEFSKVMIKVDPVKIIIDEWLYLQHFQNYFYSQTYF
jgi:hypothetical protein